MRQKKWFNRIVVYFCFFMIALHGISLGNIQIGGGLEVKASSNSLIAFYDFNSNLNNSVIGGVTTSLTQYANSASLSYGTNSALSDKTYRQWSGAVNPGYGLQMAVRQNISSVYSIAMRFSYSQATGGYRKIIDYYNFGKDNGFYLLSGKLVFYNSGVKATGVTTFSNDQIVDLIVTRNASNAFTVYSVVNGVFKTEFSYTDSSNEAAGYWNGTNTLFGFFRDEGGSEFSNGGKAYSIKVWDYALTEAEARMAADPIAVTYKQKDGTTIKTASYSPGSTVTVDSYTGVDEFRGWLGSDGKTYQPGSSFSIQTATTLTAITVPNAPTWEQEGSSYYVYGNGKPIIIRQIGSATAVFWDSDSDGAMDDYVTANGLFGGSYASFSESISSNLYIYGGAQSDTMSTRDASITMESGKVGQIYGCGRQSGATIRNVTIVLQGGNISQVQAYDSSAKASGTKSIQISGNPVVVNGINLATTSTGYLNITGPLTGAEGSIHLMNPSTSSDGTILAVAAQEANAVAAPFQLGSSGILVTGKQIVIQNHTIVTLNGQEAETEGTTQTTATYGSAMPVVTLPKKTGYLFAGYYTEPNGNGMQYYSGNGTSLRNWNKAVETITLYADWLEATSTQIIDESQFKVEAEQLNDTFHNTNLVEDPGKGVTSADLAAGAVALDLVVTDKDGNASGAAEIKEAARGMKPVFFDVTVKKTVTPSGSSAGSGTETTLVELPSSVKLIMDMTGTELEGKSSYQVFRYHNDEVQQLSTEDVDGEFYTVENNIITIYTRRFSTYAITSGEGTVFLDGETTQDNISLDVQGKVVERKVDAVYKVDISWGAMKFTYETVQKKWNPDQHAYENETESNQPIETGGWIVNGFEGGNNKILITNHSNADLLVNYTATPIEDIGVELSVRNDNTIDSTKAENQFLSKVPQEKAQAPFLQSYLWITGKPNQSEKFMKEQYQQIGTITVTLEAQQGDLTPRKQ